MPFDKEYWRAMLYIEDAFSLNCLEDEMMAYQTGIGLAKFHFLCSNFNYYKLENSIKNFHNTRYYIEQYIINIKDYDFTELNVEVKKRIVG